LEQYGSAWVFTERSSIAWAVILDHLLQSLRNFGGLARI